MSARDELQITEHELGTMTRDLDEMHRATFPEAREAIQEWGSRLARSSASRRTVLVGGLGAAGAAALAACGSKKSGGTTPSSTTSGSAGGTYSGDLQVVALAAALENLAVAGYTMALTAAGKGTYGTVPPAVATFVTTVKQQHTDHASAWNSVLSKAGKPTVTGTPLTITSATVAKLQAATKLTDVAQIAADLETAAASTYLEAVGAVSDSGGIAVAATIAPVEAQHAAILNLLLGKYPVPAAYLTTQTAVPPSALTA